MRALFKYCLLIGSRKLYANRICNFQFLYQISKQIKRKSLQRLPLHVSEGVFQNKKICRSCDELRWMNKLEKNQALIDKMNDAFERNLQWTCRQLFKSSDLIC